jgi:hypothetical protein
VRRALSAPAAEIRDGGQTAEPPQQEART